MARYRVRAGSQLPHDGQVLEAGAFVELPRHVAADTAVRDMVEEVDAAGNVVLAPLTNDFERFRPHEQVTLLEASLAEAEARVATLKAQLAAAKAASFHKEPEPVALDQPIPADAGAPEDEE
jgi:hypothetical protein